MNKEFDKKNLEILFSGDLVSVFFHLCRILPVSYNRKNCRKKKCARSTTQSPRDTHAMKRAIMQKMEVCFCKIKAQDHGNVGEPGGLTTLSLRLNFNLQSCI